MRSFAVLFTVLFFVVMSLASPLDLGRGKLMQGKDRSILGAGVSNIMIPTKIDSFCVSSEPL